jgi:hypothetical protein
MHLSKGLLELLIAIRTLAPFGVFQLMALQHNFRRVGLQNELIQESGRECSTQAPGNTFRDLQGKVAKGQDLQNEKKWVNDTLID